MAFALLQFCGLCRGYVVWWLFWIHCSWFVSWRWWIFVGVCICPLGPLGRGWLQIWLHYNRESMLIYLCCSCVMIRKLWLHFVWSCCICRLLVYYFGIIRSIYLCLGQGGDLFVFLCWCVDWLVGSLSDAENFTGGAEAFLFVNSPRLAVLGLSKELAVDLVFWRKSRWLDSSSVL